MQTRAYEFEAAFFDGLPREWITKVRCSMVAFLGRFSARRMLEDYVREVYGSGQPSRVS